MQPLSDTGPASSLTDASILHGIRQQDRQVLAEVYRQYFPLLRAWICRNQGDEEAARDIFQEAMLVIFEQAQDEAFAFTHSFRAYLMGIGRNLWRMQLRRRPTEELPTHDEGGPDLAQTIAEALQRHDRYALYRVHFTRLGQACQQVLGWFLGGESLRDIARRLDSTEKYAKKRKYQCQKKLVEAIQADPRYQELTE